MKASQLILLICTSLHAYCNIQYVCPGENIWESRANDTCGSGNTLWFEVFYITREWLEACFARDTTLMTHILYRYMVVLIIVFI